MDDAAQIVSSHFPGQLVAGAAGEGQVVVKNTGTATWSKDGGYRLGAVDDHDPLYRIDTRVDLPPSHRVAPGETFPFSILLKAPLEPKPYITDWRMVREGVHWFGDTARATVTVVEARIVNPQTLIGKHLMGYQGWFGCLGDGSVKNTWEHWSRGVPAPSTIAVDLWPDTSEFEADELFQTDFRHRDGRPARLFSSHHPKTVSRHFRWMKEYGLDGVTIGRFTVGVRDPQYIEESRRKYALIRRAAEEHGRVYMLAYDVTGHDAATLVRDIERDWAYLVDVERLTESPSCLRHRGKPIIMLWGLGAQDRPGTPEDAKRLLAMFRENPEPRYRASLVGGVPWGWRDLTACKPQAEWADVYRSFDAINPWSVTAFANDIDARSWYRDRFAADVAECRVRGIDYMPVAFPGFSWKNLQQGKGRLNAIPRHGGRFYWTQVHEAVKVGASALLTAMFDECDEGTAMFKLVSRTADLPAEGEFVALDADGEALPSDWYLRLAGAAGRLLRGELPLTEHIPTSV